MKNDILKSISFKNLHFVISTIHKKIDEESLIAKIPNIQDKNSLNIDDYNIIADEYGYTLTEFEKSKIFNLENLVLPGIIYYDNEQYILQNVTKSEVHLFNLETESPIVLLKKDFKKIGKILIFTNKIETSILYKNESWFYDILKSEWGNISKVLYISIFLTIFVFVIPLFIMSVYDRVIPNEGISTLYVLTFGVAVITLFNYIFQRVKNNIITKVNSNILFKMEDVLMKKILNINPEYDKRSMSNKLILFKELHTIKDFYATNLTTVFLDLPIFILGIVLTAFLSESLVYIPILVAFVMFGANYIAHKLLTIEYEKMYKLENNKMVYLIENISSKNEIIENNAINTKLDKNRNIGIETEEISMRMQKLKGNFSFLLQNLILLTTVLIIFFGTMEIIEKTMSMGFLIAIVILSSRMMQPIVNVNLNLLKYADVKKSFSIVNDFLQLPEYKQVNKDIVLKENIGIKIKNLSYQYKKGNTIFDDVNVDIEPGSRVAVIGNNGVGKSTLMKLLTKQLEPTEGDIFVNYFNLNEVDRGTYLSKVNKLQENNYLFKGTVFDNININNQYTFEEVYEKIEKQGLLFLINGNHKMLNLPVEENGSNLSNGEQQIIKILRNFIEDSPLVLLDDPLQFLNTNNQQLFLKFLKEYTQNKTLVLFTNDVDVFIKSGILTDIYLIENKKILKGKRKEKESAW